MRDDDKETAMIDALLDDVATQAPAPDPALMARVLADAHRAASEPAPHPVRGLWGQMADMIGGWPTLGGLALAGCAGLWLGVAPPVAVEDAAASLFGTTETVALWGVDDLLTEEVLIDG